MERPPGVPESFDVRTVVWLRFRVDVARWAVAAGRIAFPQRDAPVGETVRFEDL